MKICVNIKNSIEELLNTNVANADVFIAGFNAVELIKYRKEIKDESSYFRKMAEVSSKNKCVFICGGDTDNYGIKRHSVTVCEKGKILGICDMNKCNESCDYMPGTGNNIFNTDIGKIGIIVGQDFYNYDLLKAYAICSVDVIICLTNEANLPMSQILLRAYSYLLGLPIVFVAKDVCLSSDERGQLAFSSPLDTNYFDIKFNNEYHLSYSKTKFTK